MIGKITDEYSIKKLVALGLIPAMEQEIKAFREKPEVSIDSVAWSVGNYINAYNELLLTGRKVDIEPKTEGSVIK